MLFAPTALLILGSLIAAQPDPACTRSAECKQLALDAAARGDFETFHTLAWRAVQTGQPNDADLMFMLARAQALSGRPDDALVMLGRLADRGILHPEVETLDDFSRVREMNGWPSLLEKLTVAVPPAAPAPAPPAPVPSKRALRAVPAPRAVAPSPASIDKPDEVVPSVVPATAMTLVPVIVGAPIAIAYDKVSARTIIADDFGGTLKVLSDASGNVVDLVSRGWGGGYHSNALIIDSERGDLWVAGSRPDEDAGSIVHRVQLISGRMLYSVPSPTDAGATRFSSVALSSANVFVLDAEGGRIFELPAGAKALRMRIAVPQPDLLGLTLASDTVAYVTHATGILRVDLAAKRIEPVSASPGIPLDGIEWIGYFDNSLLAVQRRPDGTLNALRLRFDRRGRTLTAFDTFGTALAKGGAILGNTFYFVAALPAGTAIARVNLR